MNLILIGVSVISLLIGEFSTAIFVGVLVGLNVVLGARQEMKARQAVNALAKLQVPSRRNRVYRFNRRCTARPVGAT